MPHTSTSEIIISELPGQNGYLGHVLLNRPQALNALSKSMLTVLGQQLISWQNNPKVHAVIIRGAGNRAFCAGGDIRDLYMHKNDFAYCEDYFRIEYRVNKTLYHFTKPYIAFLDGLTMGGGAGVSLHGSHRIATEQLLFAMPETGIGFYPDVGIGYLLSRCPQKIGYYLGLTGHNIKAVDTQYLGLTTHTISHDQQEMLIDVLQKTSLIPQPFETVSQILEQFTINKQPSELQGYAEDIAYCFSSPTIEELFNRLQSHSHPFMQAAYQTLLQRSPLALKVTLEQLNRAANLCFDKAINLDFNITLQFLNDSNFYEGIRAAIIDKDKKPKWQPDTITAVSSAMVNNFFKGQEQL